LIGGTAGRTTLAGEGLQHQDGHSLLLAHSHPRVMAYDAAFAFDLAVLVQEGIRRMYVEGEDLIYYLTVENEPYEMLPMPEGAGDGVVRGMYLLKPSGKPTAGRRVTLLGSGSLVNEAMKAQEMLENELEVAANLWVVTSYQQLYRDALQAERWNRLHPEAEPRVPYLSACLSEEGVPVIAVSDYTTTLPYSVARWVPNPLIALGTDGFGRSDSRTALRDFFEVDAKHIVYAALEALSRRGEASEEEVQRLKENLGINPDKPDPMNV
jgi:pyruvate dehydrogenase E1 component